MHVGILTGGGDCPGLNAVIRAVTLALIGECGARVTGIERGFMGLVTRSVLPLTEPAVRDILAQGGTILGTHNKANPFAWFGAGGADVSADAMAYVRELGLDALVALGGDGTMEIAHRFEALGLPVVGVPKTIDNDLHHTDRSFGFDSAVHVVAEALDRLRTTARSHHRVMVAETMGRHAGWIALEGGIAGGADMILLPELAFDIERVAAFCRAREATHGCTLICAAEGAHAAGQPPVTQSGARLGGIGQWLQAELERRIGSEVRATLLGHVQRGGSPTPFDRVLATRLGHHAAQLVKRREYGRMVVLQGDSCTSVPIAEVAGKNRLVPLDHPLLAAARSLGVGLG